MKCTSPVSSFFRREKKKLSRHSIHIRTNVQRIDFTTVSFPFFMRGNPLNDSSPQALSLSFLSSSQIAGFPTFTRLSNSFAMKSVVSEGSFKTIEFALKQRDLLAQKFLVFSNFTPDHKTRKYFSFSYVENYIMLTIRYHIPLSELLCT